ncbi:hypothetical protein SB775_29375, partial [Peribacillus sp. SIMBA_075]|uniref:hypothetical protein n=1 Tax=Peribacillus sp. SIMBA_075 TaxID=3085813 RepID=UPI003978D44B
AVAGRRTLVLETELNINANGDGQRELDAPSESAIRSSFNTMINEWSTQQMRPGGVLWGLVTR